MRELVDRFSPEVMKFTAEHGISPQNDITYLGQHYDPSVSFSAELALDEYDRTERVVSAFGVHYLQAQINYWARFDTEFNKRLAGLGVIAVIPPGERTRLAYRTPHAEEVSLTVHRGAGLLVSAWRGNNELDTGLLHVQDKRFTDLENDLFYTIEAAHDRLEPLVVSTLHQNVYPVGEVVEVLPGDHWIEYSSDIETACVQRVPYPFWDRFKRPLPPDELSARRARRAP